MLNCSKTIELMSDYIDNELDENTRKDFEEHVNKCEVCKNELDEFVKIIGICNDIPDEELPEDFKDKLHNRLLEEQKKQNRSKTVLAMGNRYMRVITSIAAVLVIAVLLKGIAGQIIFPSQSLSSEKVAAAENSTGNASIADVASQENGEESKGSNTDSSAAITATVGEAPKIAAYTEEKALADSYSADIDGAAASPKFSARKADEKIHAKEKKAEPAKKVTIKAEDDPVPPKEINITVFVTSLDDGEALTKKLASANGAEIFTPALIANEDQMNFTAFDQEKTNKDQQALVADTTLKMMTLRLPNANYDRFVNELKKMHGLDNVSIKLLGDKEVEQRINEINKELSQIKDSINSNNQQENDVQQENDELNKSKECLEEELKSIQSSENYTYIVITFVQK